MSYNHPFVALGLQIAEKRFGMSVVSERLGTVESTIRGWRSGETSIPDGRFRLLVDLLTELDQSWVRRLQGEQPKS